MSLEQFVNRSLTTVAASHLHNSGPLVLSVQIGSIVSDQARKGDEEWIKKECNCFPSSIQEKLRSLLHNCDVQQTLFSFVNQGARLSIHNTRQWDRGDSYHLAKRIFFGLECENSQVQYKFARYVIAICKLFADKRCKIGTVEPKNKCLLHIYESEQEDSTENGVYLKLTTPESLVRFVKAGEIIQGYFASESDSQVDFEIACEIFSGFLQLVFANIKTLISSEFFRTKCNEYLNLEKKV